MISFFLLSAPLLLQATTPQDASQEPLTQEPAEVSLALPTVEVDTSQLSPELLLAHPGLFRGDYDQVRADWLQALTADRSSPLAAFTAQRLAALDGVCSRGLPADRLAELIEGVDDSQSSFALKRLFLRELRRSRFADTRPVFADDLFQDWFTNWRVLTDWGPLGAPSPLRLQVVPPDPRASKVLDAENGLEHHWYRMQRQANRTLIHPNRLSSREAGLSYAALWLRADVDIATLELRASEGFRCWWNGMPTFEDLHEGPTTGEKVHRALVHVQTGWNLLLVEMDAASDMRLGGRLLDRGGRILPFYEWDGQGQQPDLPETLVPAEVLAVPAWLPTAQDPYSLMLRSEMLVAREHADQALALKQPENLTPLQQALWLHTRYHAVNQSKHLPQAVRRSRLMSLEKEMRELGFFDLAMELSAARRLLREDKADDALAAVDSIFQVLPNNLQARLLQADALLEIDDTGTLAKPLLLAIHQDYPQLDAPLEELQAIAMDHDDRPTALALARLRTKISGDRGQALIPLLLQGNEKDRAQAQAMVDRLLQEEPQLTTGLQFREQLLRLQGMDEALIATLRRRVEQQPGLPSPLLRLAKALLQAGHTEDAIQAMQEALALLPGDADLRADLSLLQDQADAAQNFFAAFAADKDAQLALREKMSHDNSTAMLLDSGMVYLFADGSFAYQVDNLDLPLDRQGTEQLHEMPVIGTPLLAQIYEVDGNILEPHQVEDSWVMPSLDPGDVIATSYLRESKGLPGLAPKPGIWSFASTDKDFALSRWVIFVPNDLAGRFVEHNFDGSHEIVDWQGGKVHIFERRDSSRVEPEIMMPSNNEILPWVSFGDDRPLVWEAEDWRRWFQWQTSIPADIELELRAFLAKLDLSGSKLEQARTIYAAVDQHVLDYNGGGDVTDIWTLRRGNPVYFLSALLRLADIPHEWALLQPTAPELDTDPLRPFSDGSEFNTPALRLSPLEEGSDVTWLMLANRGTPFGSLPAEMLGAKALVLEPKGFRIETTSTKSLEDIWDLDLQVAYTIQADESAQVLGSVRITGSQGATLREQLAQISPEQRDQGLRQLTGQMVKGLDLERAQLKDLEVAGAPLMVEFSGTIPNFVQQGGEQYGARLRLPEFHLGDGFGPAIRNLDFAFRSTMRLRTRVQLDTQGTWKLEYGPTPLHLQRDGFAYDFEVEKDEQHLAVNRTLWMRGLEIPADEFPNFVDKLRQQENQEARAVRLIPNAPPAPEQEAPTSEEN